MVLDFLNLLETTDTRIARHEWKEWDCQRNEWCKCPIALGVESQYGESNHDKLWEDSELGRFPYSSLRCLPRPRLCFACSTA